MGRYSYLGEYPYLYWQIQIWCMGFQDVTVFSGSIPRKGTRLNLVFSAARGWVARTWVSRRCSWKHWTRWLLTRSRTKNWNWRIRIRNNTWYLLRESLVKNSNKIQWRWDSKVQGEQRLFKWYVYRLNFVHFEIRISFEDIDIQNIEMFERIFRNLEYGRKGFLEHFL